MSQYDKKRGIPVTFMYAKQGLLCLKIRLGPNILFIVIRNQTWGEKNPPCNFFICRMISFVYQTLFCCIFVSGAIEIRRIDL